jgi:hypothetical protein
MRPAGPVKMTSGIYANLLLTSRSGEGKPRDDLDFRSRILLKEPLELF